MNEDFSVSFFIKRKKVLKSGETTIFAKIYKKGERSEFALEKSIVPSQWDSKRGLAKGISRQNGEINYFLETTRVKINIVAENMTKEGFEASPILIKEHMVGKVAHKCSLLQLYREHNEKVAKLEGIDFAKETVVRYKTSYKHTANYIKHKYNRNDISFDEINHLFIENYIFYLKTELKCCHNTAIKYIRNFKKIVRIAMANGWIKTDPFINIKLSCNKVDRVYLDEDELETLMKKEFKIERLEVARDLFVFSCFTGLPFIEIKNLTHNSIVKDKENTYWIDGKRTKTKVEFQVPLLKVPQRIIEKYKDNPICKGKGVVLPVFSNQNYNAYLKEVADICEIKKPITTHTARHTFATTVTLSNGIAMEAVSKMLGHTNLATTKIYARITEKLVINNMKKIEHLYA